MTPSTTFATLDLPLTPPEPGAALLVTVFFQEKSGGFLRIGWQSAGVATEGTSALPDPGEASQSSVLCDNFYEGIGMSNQRSLLVPADAMKQPGELVFQCGDSTLGISRIQLQWLQNSTGLSSPAITDTLVTPAVGRTQLAADLAGQPATAQDPAWHDRVVDVPITDLPLRIEQGVDFPVQLDGVPTMARLALKETGLPWGQHLVVWINNQRAGILQPSVPELGDAGYPDDKGTPYVGWREGSFYIPAGLLVPGDDTLQVSAEPDTPPGDAGRSERRARAAGGEGRAAATRLSAQFNRHGPRDAEQRRGGHPPSPLPRMMRRRQPPQPRLPRLPTRPTAWPPRHPRPIRTRPQTPRRICGIRALLSLPTSSNSSTNP